MTNSLPWYRWPIETDGLPGDYLFKVVIFHGELLNNQMLKSYFWGFHWIGLRENLQETMVFTIKYGGSCKFSLKPTQWWLGWSTLAGGREVHAALIG